MDVLALRLQGLRCFGLERTSSWRPRCRCCILPFLDDPVLGHKPTSCQLHTVHYARLHDHRAYPHRCSWLSRGVAFRSGPDQQPAPPSADLSHSTLKLPCTNEEDNLPGARGQSISQFPSTGKSKFANSGLSSPCKLPVGVSPRWNAHFQSDDWGNHEIEENHRNGRCDCGIGSWTRQPGTGGVVPMRLESAVVRSIRGLQPLRIRERRGPGRVLGSLPARLGIRVLLRSSWANGHCPYWAVHLPNSDLRA